MPAINIIAVAPIAYVEDVNAVLEAMGRGPGSLGTKASDVPDQAFGATSTHMFMCNQSAAAEFQAQMLAWAGDGDLPPLPEGVVWGEDGVISAADAMAAGAHLAVASFNENFTPDEQVAATLGALGLYRHLAPVDV